MGRTLLTIVSVVAGVIVLLLIAAAIAVATIDVNTFIGPMLARVKQETGRELAIRGGADISLSLEPRLRLRDVTFGNVPGAKTRDMVTAREVDLQVALLPLLRRKVDVIRFTLVDPRIVLETDATGHGNWELGGKRDTAAAKDAPAPASPALAFGVGELAVERGVVEYRDGKSGDTTHIEIDHLLLRAREPSAPVVAQFNGRVQGVPIALEGSAGPLDAVLQRRFPLPVTLKGEIRGRKLDAQAQLAAPPDRTDLTDLTDLKLAFGESRVAGSLSVVTSGPRTLLRFNLKSPLLRLADLPLAAPGATKQPAPAAAQPSQRHLFAATPISFDGLRSVDAQGSLAVDRLILPSQRALTAVAATVALNNGRLQVAPLAAGVLGGRIDGKVTIDATHGREPDLAVALNGRGFDLAALLAAFDVPSKVQGGKTDVVTDLRLAGSSPRSWASSARGLVLVNVGPAEVPRVDSGLPTGVIDFLNAVNPFRLKEDRTDLKCAVVRLPFNGGVAQIDRGIGVETSRVGIAASGTIDLRSETLSLSIRPSLREKLPVDVAQFAGLVRLEGPIVAPKVRMDPIGAAEAVARIGAATGTGGLSVLGEALLRGTVRGQQDHGQGGECAVAAGRGAATAAASPKGGQPPAPPQPKTVSPIDEIGRALQQLRPR